MVKAQVFSVGYPQTMQADKHDQPDRDLDFKSSLHQRRRPSGPEFEGKDQQTEQANPYNDVVAIEDAT